MADEHTADDLTMAWNRGALTAIERVEAEADAARDIGMPEHAVLLRALAREMRAEFDQLPQVGLANAE